jgi:hypothetical protein
MVALLLPSCATVSNTPIISEIKAAQGGGIEVKRCTLRYTKPTWAGCQTYDLEIVDCERETIH